MTQFSDFCSMQQDAQRRVYEMQQRASRALDTQPEAQREECTPQPVREERQPASCDSEKLLILVIVLLIARGRSSGTGSLILALLYLCI